MIRANIIQVVIIILALIVGFTGLQYLLTSIITIIAWSKLENNYGNDFLSGVGFAIVLALAQASICFFLIKKSDAISKSVVRRANIGGTFSFIIQTVDLLFVVLFALGIYLLAISLPDLLTNIFYYFKGSNPNGFMIPENFPDTVNWPKNILQLLLPLILIMFARRIANFFSKSVTELPLTMEDIIEVANDHDDDNLA